MVLSEGEEGVRVTRLHLVKLVDPLDVIDFARVVAVLRIPSGEPCSQAPYKLELSHAATSYDDSAMCTGVAATLQLVRYPI